MSEELLLNEIKNNKDEYIEFHNIMTLRDRDTMKQVRIKVDKVSKKIMSEIF